MERGHAIALVKSFSSLGSDEGKLLEDFLSTSFLFRNFPGQLPFLEFLKVFFFHLKIYLDANNIFVSLKNKGKMPVEGGCCH